MDNTKTYCKPNWFAYTLARFVSFLFATFIFRRKILRNEVRHAKGAYVILANHEMALDFVNLIGATHRRMTFVISNSFYQTLPVKKILDWMHVIPKQQFQTSVSDMKKMKAVIQAGQPLVIYPAGLMCEDGLSTPIPRGTFKFIKWLGAEVYIARSKGTYFNMPKWTKGIRPGRTTLDIYRLFSAEDTAKLSVEEIQAQAEDALLFDAYREQEELQAFYSKNNDIRGLENVLYICPHCGKEYTVQSSGVDMLGCSSCGYQVRSDRFGFLSRISSFGPVIRYVSDWSSNIQQFMLQQLESHPEQKCSVPVDISMIDSKTSKFVPAGSAELTISAECISLCGKVNNEDLQIEVPIRSTPTLPFRPGQYLEVQHGLTIYRCHPQDPRCTTKLIHTIKAFYQLAWAEGAEN
ncbi:MAG: 1-acyl-sn-glycerol-3-phosphate acyltransferase [Oscillospiraceae bacterium]|nr:1-acyl-sn-glycerol-3-phosphate acyltransferase [Oscillospiraceae bacterium]